MKYNNAWKIVEFPDAAGIFRGEENENLPFGQTWVSLESVTFPGFYLKVDESKHDIWVDEAGSDNHSMFSVIDDQFLKYSTFIVKKSLFDYSDNSFYQNSIMISFELASMPGYYVRYVDWTLVLQKQFDDSDVQF